MSSSSFTFSLVHGIERSSEQNIGSMLPPKIVWKDYEFRLEILTQGFLTVLMVENQQENAASLAGVHPYVGVRMLARPASWTFGLP